MPLYVNTMPSFQTYAPVDLCPQGSHPKYQGMIIIGGLEEAAFDGDFCVNYFRLCRIAFCCNVKPSPLSRDHSAEIRGHSALLVQNS